MSQSIIYAGINKKVEFEGDQESLLDISISNAIPHIHECGGHGICTTCRVRVLDGTVNLSPKTEFEKNNTHSRKWDPSIRLACQAKPHGDVKLQRLIWSNGEVNQLQKELAPEGRAEERPIAVIFCDLRNYTNISSQNSNFDLAFMLNRFYTALGEPILMNNGIIYQYAGDAIIGVFGTIGGSKEKNCLDAIRAGLGMQYALDLLNKTELKDIDITLQSGIGINFGKAYVGHLGHPTHRQFSVIGDPVNVASRIQNETKRTGSKILLSRSVYNNLEKETLVLGQPFLAQVAGKEDPLELIELKGFLEMDLQLELQASLHLMLEDEDEFSRIFYEKVFTKAPFVKALFRKNMTDQGRLLTHMLGGIVYSLSRPLHLKTGLAKLGQSHVKYGVKASYFPVVKEALIETIGEVLGEHQTNNTINAWNSAMDLIIKLMQNLEKSTHELNNSTS